MIRNALRGVMLIGALLIVPACGTSDSHRRRVVPDHFDDIASAKVAVLSVSPWTEVQSEMQPNFSLNEDAALALALQATQQVDERVLRALDATARLALPPLPRNQTTKEAADATGDAPSTPAPKPPPGTASALPGQTTAVPSGVDPMLRYLAATSIYQEIKMLNRYVKDATTRPNSVAVVVRLQASLMPKMRGLPYDAHTTIALLPSSIERSWNPTTKTWTPDSKPACESATVELIPLLVTDDLEATLASRSAESVERFGLALQAMVQGVGVGGEFGKTNDRLRSVAGREFNSLFSLQRLGKSEVVARFGAAQHGASEYAMESRTHNITLLVNLQCPNGLPEDVTRQTLTVMARTEFIDALSGVKAKEDDEFVRMAKELSGIKAKYHIDDPIDETERKRLDGLLRELGLAASRNRWDEFMRWIPDLLSISGKTALHANEVAASLWADLIAMGRGNPYSYASFEVEVGGDTAPIPPPAQTVVVADGKNGQAVGDLYGGEGLRSEILKASLTTTNPNLTLMASSVTAGNAGTSATAVFHSLAPLGITKNSGATLKLTLLDEEGCRRAHASLPDAKASDKKDCRGATISRSYPVVLLPKSASAAKAGALPVDK